MPHVGQVKGEKKQEGSDLKELFFGEKTGSGKQTDQLKQNPSTGFTGLQYRPTQYLQILTGGTQMRFCPKII